MMVYDRGACTLAWRVHAFRFRLGLRSAQGGRLASVSQLARNKGMQLQICLRAVYVHRLLHTHSAKRDIYGGFQKLRDIWGLLQ